MRGDIRVRLRALLQAGGGALALQAGPALAEEQFFFDLSAGTNASRNPFLQSGDNTAAAGAFIQVDPQLQILDEVSEVKLYGTFRYNHYTRSSGDDVSGQGGLSVERRLSPLTLLRGRASARVAQSSALDFTVAPGASPTDATAPVIFPDVTFAGTRSRTTVLGAGVGLDHDLNERERLVADLAVTTTQFSRAGQNDYRFVTGEVDYRRTISVRTSVFGALRVGYSDFLGSNLDDGVIVAPTVGISTQLNPRLSLEVGLGTSLSRVNELGGRKTTRLVASARILLCEAIVASKGCFELSRGSQPTALSGLTTVTTANFSYNIPIGQRDQLAASANYTATDEPSTRRAGQSTDLLTASATYNRTFNRRLSAYVTPSYARIFDSLLSPRSDIAVRVGVRYRIGSEG